MLQYGRLNLAKSQQRAGPMITYEKILDQVEHLSPDDQLRLMEQMVATLRRQMGTGEARRITELKGLGKEIWQDVDVQRYIDEERDSWTG
jgi:hypothetical protein